MDECPQDSEIIQEHRNKIAGGMYGHFYFEQAYLWQRDEKFSTKCEEWSADG